MRRKKLALWHLRILTSAWVGSSSSGSLPPPGDVRPGLGVVCVSVALRWEAS